MSTVVHTCWLVLSVWYMNTIHFTEVDILRKYATLIMSYREYTVNTI